MTCSGHSHGFGLRTALLTGYAVFTFLAFPHPIGDRVIDLGVVLAWFGPTLLLLGLAGLSPARAAKAGFVAGLVAHAAILHWIYIVTVVYGHAPRIAGGAARRLRRLHLSRVSAPAR